MKAVEVYIELGITGFESPASEYKELGLSLDNLLIGNPNATFVGLAKGNSMSDVGIYDGDILIIDRSLPIEHGDIIVANFNGTFVCKLLDKINRSLVSASSDYTTVSIGEHDTFQIEGVVIHSVRMFKNRNRIVTRLSR